MKFKSLEDLFDPSNEVPEDFMQKEAVSMDDLKKMRSGLSEFDPRSMKAEDLYQHSLRLRESADRAIRRGFDMSPSSRSELWEEYADIADAKSKLLKSLTKK
jgi:hypothetical protein